MRAISLHEPYASLIALGIKSIETRSWSTPYRGALAIHAAKRWDQEQRELCASWPFAEFLPTGWGPALGKVVAVCHLHDVRLMTAEGCEARRDAATFAEQHDDLTNQVARDALLGFWQPGRYAWILTDVRALVTPIPTRGMQGIWPFELPVTAAFVRPREVA